jgi:hypothetical protein
VINFLARKNSFILAEFYHGACRCQFVSDR